MDKQKDTKGLLLFVAIEGIAGLGFSRGFLLQKNKKMF